MALPQQFSESKHIKEVARNVVNKLVKEEFSEPNQATWEPNVTTPKASLRKACTHELKDSLVLTVARLLVFYLVKGKIKELFPSSTFAEAHNSAKGLAQYPQVTLYFTQDKGLVAAGRQPLELECSFRLVGETRASMTRASAIALASKIKQEFIELNKGVQHNKGKLMATYYDYARGYKLQILCIDRQEGIDLIKRVLKVRNHTFEDEYFQIGIPERDSENNPVGVELVLGIEATKPRWRPTGRVRFRYAMLSFPGFAKQFPLLDTTGKYKDSFV